MRLFTCEWSQWFLTIHNFLTCTLTHTVHFDIFCLCFIAQWELVNGILPYGRFCWSIDYDIVYSICINRYNQATAMCRHYKRPILLIEFEESRSFSLQVMGSNIIFFFLHKETHLYIYITVEYSSHSRWNLEPKCGFEVGPTNFALSQCTVQCSIWPVYCASCYLHYFFIAVEAFVVLWFICYSRNFWSIESESYIIY